MDLKFNLNPLPNLNGPTGSHTIEIWAKSKIVLFLGHAFIYAFKYIFRDGLMVNLECPLGLRKGGIRP